MVHSDLTEALTSKKGTKIFFIEHKFLTAHLSGFRHFVNYLRQILFGVIHF